MHSRDVPRVIVSPECCPLTFVIEVGSVHCKTAIHIGAPLYPCTPPLVALLLKRATELPTSDSPSVVAEHQTRGVLG